MEEKKIHGDTKEFISPSGYKFLIREQTGDDDDVISNAKDTADGISAAKFLSSIIISTDFTGNSRLSKEDALNLKLCDKYFLFIVSRIFSLGQILKFEYDWGNGKPPVAYEEDLLNYIWEYGNSKKPFPNTGDKEYFPFRIKPHPHGKETDMEFTTTTNKVLKFDFINSHGENYQMKLPDHLMSKNQELKARNLRQKVGEEWIKIESFKNFLPMEMVEIRKIVLDNDPIIELFTEIENPYNSEKQYMPILGNADFFFPREI